MDYFVTIKISAPISNFCDYFTWNERSSFLERHYGGPKLQIRHQLWKYERKLSLTQNQRL